MRAPRMILFKVVVLNIILCFFLVACGAGDEPAKVAEKFIRALAANDRVDLQETVNPEELNTALDPATMFQAFGAVVGGIQLEIVDLQAKTISNDGQHAAVSVTGKVKTSVLGAQSIDAINERLMLIRSQDRWYVSLFRTGIAGKWRDRSAGSIWEYSSDGTVSITSSGETSAPMKGKWKLLDQNTLEIDWDSEKMDNWLMPFRMTGNAILLYEDSRAYQNNLDIERLERVK